MKLRLSCALLVILLGGCSQQPQSFEWYPSWPPGPVNQGVKDVTQRRVDLLLVVDSTVGRGIQGAFAEAFAGFLDGHQGIFPSLPDLRIGVISGDLGAGSYGLVSCEQTGGEGAKLQNEPRSPGCAGPLGSLDRPR